MNQFRKDPVSGEWIIVAPGRAKRPHELFSARPARVPSPKDRCPFEDLQATGNWPPYVAIPDAKRWEVVVIPNKYPALTHHAECPTVTKEGLYEYAEGSGYHDLLVFRDHDRSLDARPHSELVTAFRALQERYREVARDQCLIYAATHFNWGETAGASLYHPHFQLLTLPIIPPQILHSLDHSSTYFRRTGGCVHCNVIASEAKSRARLVIENDHALAIIPFAARQPFEVKIYPKAHLPNFEDTPERHLAGVVEVLQRSLGLIREHLGDPDLNFFVHTAPLKNKELHAHYHWHIEIIPKISIPAGFELSTGVLINVLEPEAAAAMLRGEA